MVENSPQPSASETLKPSQISTVARLGSRQDAVCAGKDVHLGFVERSPGGTARIKKDQERKASEVAFLLGQAGATKDGDPYTADDILGLGEKVKQLTNESGPYAGVLIQAFDADVIGSRSAAQLTVAIHELERASQKVPGTPDKTQDQILEEVEKAVREFNKKNDPSKGDVTELAIALVDKKGNVSGGIGTENLRMVVIDTDGKKEDVIPGYKLKPGQKIIIGEKTKIGSLKSTDTKGKSLDDIVGSAVGNTAETRAASGMAAEKDNGTPQIEKKKKVEVKVAQAARAPLKNETPPNNKESEDRIFSEGAFAGVIDGAGGYARGGEAAEAVRDGLAKMVRGEAFTVTDSDGNVFNIPNGEPMNFDGLTQAQVEARLKNIAINLNRIIRSEDTRPAAAKAKDPGPSACMAVGNIHLNEKGELTLSYLNVGDSEIAIIRGGKVILVPNDSVRNKANKESPPNIDFYLNEREAAVRLADGKATKKLGDQVNVGSIPLQEGDRVVYLTDGVAEDLQNIRGIMAADGKVTPTAGDPTPIALDILGQIDPNTPVENMPQAILKLLDDVRQKNGIKITRHSNTYNSDIDRKMVPQGDLNIVVGGKGATQDRGYDDGESVVVVEAHVKLPPTDPPKPKEVIVPDKVVVHEDDKTAKVKVSEYIQTPEYKQNVEWFKRVLEEVKNAPAGDPDVDALKQKPGETPLDYAKRVAPALRTYLNEESKHANSPLSQIAAKAEDTSSGNNPDRNDELTSLHAIEVVLNRAPGLYDSSFGVEVGGNPEQIKADFKEAFEIYEAGMADLEARKDNLSPSEKEEYARYKYTKEIYHRNESDPNWQHEVELRAYGQKPQHFIQEGVPVDGIMDYLTAQITVARAANRDADVQKYTRLFATLKDSSDFYVNIPLKNRRERKIPGVTRFTTKSQLMEARHQLEAERRSVDPLRTSTKPNDTERMQEDWDRGVNDMKRRRELIVPEKTKKELGEIYRKKTNENADPNKVLTELADLDPAPENERKKGPDPEPAPTNDDDEPHPPRPRPPTPTPLTDNDLKAQVVVAAENGHYIHSNNNNTDHTMALIETSGTHWYSRIPLLGGVLGSVFHPVQNIWRNGLARESVREQHRRFNDRMSIILKSHFMEGVGADGQMRIPVELTSQLIDKSIAEGRKLIKEQGFFTRLGWAARNIVARTTTLGETAEMHFAKQWLEDNLVENKPGSRDASIEAIYRRALDEQNSVGSRIALGGMRRGEKREVVANSPLEAPIKSAIAAYFAEMDRLSTETDTEKKNKLIAYAKTALVAQINTIGKTEDSGSSIDLNKGIELASNILSVVDDLSKTFGNTEKSKWKVLNEQNKWGDFKLNIIAAESRWGGEGGAESIRTGSLREKVLQRMAERELFVGENERTHGVQMASLSILSDVVTYGDAYLLGMSTSAALFGANAASKVIGGLGGIMGMSAAKEMGLRIGGTEIFKGRYRGEVAQLSREMALGKKSPADAKIRGEMGGALVNAETVDVIAGRIEPLLAKDPATLTEREAFLLLKEIAQLDARMRIADISGTKDLQFTVQNYIIYNEMQKNEQYLRLKSAVLKGLTNLTTYKTQYVDFGGTDPLTSGVELAYGKSQTNMGLFEKFSALAEAQLRVGSRTEVLKWLQDENGVFNNNAGLGMSKDEAKTLVNTFYNEAKGTVKQEQSIRSKEKVLRKLALKRAATIVVQSALIMPIGGAIYGAEAQLFQGIGQEVQHAIREGIPTWSGEWGALLNGSATPLHPPTIFQEGVLTVRHTIDHVVPAVTPPHDEVIDNVHVQLPARYHYERIPQGQPGAGNDRIIDVIDGHVVKDLSNVGLRIDAQGHLIEVDGRGNIINNDAIADFHASGIELHQLGTTTETLLSPTTGTITSTVDGQNVQIPTGTHWVRDSSGNNDLVLDVNPNMILVDNAHVLNGQLTADHFYHSAAANTIDVQQNGTNIPGSSINGSSVWDKAGDYRFVWAKDNTHLGAVHDYIYKTNDAAHPYAVEMKFPGDAIIHNPNTGVDESLNAAFQDGRAGMLYNIPGHGQIFVPSHEVDAQGWIVNRLDPSDTVASHIVTLPDGSHIQAGQFAQLVLNEGKIATHGPGELGSMMTAHGRDAYNLGSNGQSGDIMGGYIDPTSNPYGHTNGTFLSVHELKAAGPLSTGPVETPPAHEPIVTIGAPITQDVPTFAIDAPAGAIPISIPLIPVPMGRINIEAAESGITDQNSVATPLSTPPPTPPSSTPPASAENGIELTADEKSTIQKEAEGEINSRIYATPQEMLDHLKLKPGISFGKTEVFEDHEEEKKAKEGEWARIKACQDALILYEKMRREYENAVTDIEKKKTKKNFEEAEKTLIAKMRAREGKKFVNSPFGKEEVEDLNTFLDEQKKKKIEKSVAEKEKAKKDAKKKKKDEEDATAEHTPTTENPKLTKRFENITESVDLNHAYKVEKVPSAPVSGDLKPYELIEPYFVPFMENGTVVGIIPSKNVVPYVYDLMEVEEDKQNKRYVAAEAATHNDSGVFAIAAASAKTPKEQAGLYKYLSESVLAVHGNNEGLLSQWLTAQENDALSNDAFIHFDAQRTNDKEKLFVLNASGQIDNDATVARWKTRIAELKTALSTDALKEEHIRWIEFLSHSVKVPELIKKAQSTA